MELGTTKKYVCPSLYLASTTLAYMHVIAVQFNELFNGSATLSIYGAILKPVRAAAKRWLV